MTGFPLDWRAPLVLSALVLVPAVIAFLVWARRRRRAALGRFAAENLLPALLPDLDDRRRTWRAGMIVAALTLLVVALAGPMWGFRWEEVRREGVDLIVAIDTSRSMLATDVKPSRLARAKLAVRDLLGELHGDRIGLVAFAGSAFVQCPLTLDYGALTQSLDAIDVGIIPKGGTALAEAIDTSLGAFDGREGKHQAIILITDGEDHEGKVKEATARAAERGVKVFTVGLGTTEGELIPAEGSGYLKDRSGQVVKSRLDEETLKQIAVDTGAVYLHATGASLALGDLYRDYIATMEKRELASTLEKRYEHRFQIPLAVVVVLLVVEALVGDRRTTRLRWSRRHRRATAAPPTTDTAATGRAAAAAAIVVALLSVAWLDPHAHTREANQLYAAGKYDDAVAAYNEGLVDHPDSNLLHFNLGDAEYKRGKYDEALAAFEQVHPTDDDHGIAARAAYNAGNATYRKAQALAASDPQKALEGYAAALVAYRRAIVADPTDADAKLNYELVLQKRAELQKKLDEQRQQQQQQKNDQQQQQQQADQQQKQDEQQQQQQQGGEQQNADQQQKGDEQKNEQKADEQQQREQQNGEQQQAGAAQPTPGAEQQAQGGAGEQKPDEQAAAASEPPTGEKRDGEMTKQEATALLDAQRGQEVQPGDVVRRLQGAVVAEPAQDW